MRNIESYHVVALFSGGLDSIVAAKLMQEQGHSVLCLHFCTPFFGKPEKITHWQKIYGLTIRAVDVGDEFVNMLVRRPVHGFGSVLNPCVDCKVLMMRHARRIMDEVGACCIVSGEVIGQRPMSQRRDTLNVIARDGGVEDRLLRPLCAKHLAPTFAEREGLVDRERMLDLFGRGRKGQMALAEHFKLKEIPTPAGGCRLAEQENARSYWPLLHHIPQPTAKDFYLTAKGRQLWSAGEHPLWLTIGRKMQDNEDILALAGPDDLLFKTANFPGPVGLGRVAGQAWTEEAITSAAAVVASYANKAVDHHKTTGEAVAVRVHPGSLDAPGRVVDVIPQRVTPFGWGEQNWESTKASIKEEAKALREQESA